MAVCKGHQHYVDGFDLMQQAEMCVLRMQNAFQFVPRESRIVYPELLICDTRECPVDLPVMRTTGDRLKQMKRVKEHNDIKTRDWVKCHEDQAHP